MSDCRCRSVWAVLSLCCLLAVGCSRTEDVAAPTEVADVGRSPQKIQPKPEASPDDPADAVRRLIASLAAGRSDAVVESIPESYRKDLDDFLSEHAGAIQPSLRRDFADAIAQFAHAVGQKQEFVLGSNRIGFEGYAAEWIRTHLSEVSQFVATLAGWSGWSDDRTLNARSLIEAAVNAIASNPEIVRHLSQVEVSTHSRTGEQAVVRLESSAGGEGYELEVVKVECCWVPAAVAANRNRIANPDESPPQSAATDSASLKGVSDRLNDIADVLAAVSTQAEFDAAADRATTLLLATAAQADTEPRKLDPTEFITIVVEGELTERQKDELLWELAQATDAPTSALADATDRANGPGMIATVGPVGDMRAFAERSKTLVIEHVNQETRTITARLKTP